MEVDTSTDDTEGSSTMQLAVRFFITYFSHILLQIILSHNGSLKRLLMLYNYELVQKKRAALVRIWV